MSPIAKLLLFAVLATLTGWATARWLAPDMAAQLLNTLLMCN